MANKKNTEENTEVEEMEENDVVEAVSEGTPEDADKKAKAEKLAALRESLNKAKTVLFTFIETDEYKALADDVKDAIVRLAKKASPTSAKASTQGFLQELFPEVGHVLDEFELFKSTKMGRAEMRKKVFYAMKKCANPAEKMWVRFDKALESWVLDSIGSDVPSNWTDADLPKTRAIG